MASNATIFKTTLQIADMDRNYYADHALTIARHPSETDERMMVRVLAFVWHAHAALEFGRGLSAADEPDLWRKDLTGSVDLWVEVGQPDEKRLRKACNRAGRVVVYTYGGRGADLWWEQNREALARFDNLTVVNLPYQATRALAALAQRGAQLQCTVQEVQVWIGDGQRVVHIEPEVRQGALEGEGR